MAKTFTLKAEDRTERPNVLRRNALLPAVLYGHGVKPISIQLDTKAFQKVYTDAGSTSLVMLTVGDTDHTVLIRDIQRHPLNESVMHVDFYQVRLDEKISAQVPLTFVGEAPAVKDLGGVLVRQLDELNLEALPQNLPHDIEVDISTLDNFEKVIHVKDITLPEGIELFHEPDDVVALVQAPRTQEEIDADLSEEVKEDVESVEGVEDKEEPAEGEEGEAEAEADTEASQEE